ncbi:TetR/AcrR family transcriptional regulator [Pendulispora rubella]|uniref:TetR/AcrR family transcriptional regulator n=1 Tax=Pendulispora rubella TaxID=2741070 RepID=A0ABZ2KUJ5_9BACT
MSSERRAVLINTALRLFLRDGFHATGIDKILAESGVAKMTLYKHFGSKDELIAAVIEHCDEQHRPWIISETEKRAKSPRRRLLALFDVYTEWLSNDFAGCIFVKAASEYGSLDSPLHRAAKRHKDAIREYAQRLCEEAGAKHPQELARQIAMLLEGSLVTAMMNGELDAAKVAKKVAETLLASEL